ncbi:zinc finger (CCCH type) motif-containing protein [Besnoitia besnoiti]|uniref:Zinc finger (CCCH type) motif-containing protein n=1 Tax=Besnoitia besnoiti TaxID=94643 RepID=A0A2A9MEP9_BESBE|nr:zinc finger (CCCH type) motif-containing protein [Besnoitia besnoiti]PFH34107.1 zinc finger (CCCH type) motif-containing protein [Besnoitia besnoiti]
MEDTGGVTCRPDRPSNLSTQNEETESCRIIDGSEDRSPCVPRVDPREDRFDQAMEAALYVETKELKRRPKLKRMKLQFYKTKM